MFSACPSRSFYTKIEHVFYPFLFFYLSYILYIIKWDFKGVLPKSLWCWFSWLEFADLNIEPKTGNYYPTVFFNEFWLLRDKLIMINDTIMELPLNLEVGPISMTKWQLFHQIDQSFQIHRSYGSMLEGEADELKVLPFALA